MVVKQISAVKLSEKLQQDDASYLILDVREPFEFEFARLEGSTLIPLGQLAQWIEKMNTSQEIVVICHHGIRSQQAAEFLVYKGFSNVLNLVGGIDAWSCEVDPAVPRY